MTTPYNILMIHVDQWRGDCLSRTGHPIVHTPFLDLIANRGTTFHKAYTSSPSCIASRASLMTGLKPKNHGRLGYKDGVPWNYKNTLAGTLTKHGYQTQAVGKMHVFPERNRLGFENIVLHDGFLHFARAKPNYELYDDYTPWLRDKTNYHADYFDHGVSCNSYIARPWDKEEHLHPTNYVTSESIDFLRKRDTTKPFFLYTSYHRPHPPYDPPQWAFDQYINEDMPDSPIGDWAQDFSYLKESFNPLATYDSIPKKWLQRAKAGYYGSMTHIDHQINRLVETLTDFGVGKNTYIIFTSDHGELMGDHNFFRKAYPFEGSSRVPLIIVPPIDLPTPKISDSHQLVEMKDIMATILDMANIENLPPIDGISALPCMQKDVSIQDYIHGEHTLGSASSAQWIRTDRYKYSWISKDGKELLFDLDNDPLELKNLASDKNHQETLIQHRQLLIKELTGREEGFVHNKQLMTGVDTPPVLKFLLEESSI